MKLNLFKKVSKLPYEDRHLWDEIERTKWAIDAARNNFEQVVDPILVDCYIFELNAAQLRYQFLLKRAKMREA